MSTLADRSTISLVLQLLERRERLRLLVALGVILFGSILEMASLGLIIPVIQAVIGADERSTYEWLPLWLQEMSYQGFVRILMVALVGLFLVKNLFLLGSSYFQQRFQLAVTNRIVQRLFETYLRQPYEFHLSNSSAVLVRNVQEYSGAAVGGGVAPLLTILTDTVTGLGFLAILIIVQPASTLILLAVFSLSGFLFLKVSRSRTKRWGAERVRHRGILMEMLLSGLGGIKEIQLFGRDDEVLRTHRESLGEAARSFYLFGVVQQIPRAAFEVIAVASVAALVVYSTLSDSDIQETTLIIALFGVVAFRMLPSINRIIQAMQQFSFGRSALEGAVESLSLIAVRKSSRRTVVDDFVSIELRSIRYRYPGTTRVVVDIDAFKVNRGDSLGIVGESGSGKSTLVDILLGILSPEAGAVSVNGNSIADDPRSWQDRVGYVPQHVYLLDTSIRRNVAFGLPNDLISDVDVRRALRMANIETFVNELPKGLDTEVGERGVRLSGGQRQRLGIARALYGNPEVIVLDEATSALDSETEKEIVESFREIARERTLIVVAHRTSTLAYCSRLIRLENGRIVQDGTYEEVIGSLSAS